MLSPRILHFSSHQIFWDCATKSACEAIPGGLPLPLDGFAATERHWRDRLSLTKEKIKTPATPTVSLTRARTFVGPADDSLEKFWKSAVRNYTRCKLTKPEKDRLAAIWGVAKLVRDATRDEYGVGLWRKELHEQLAWRVVDCKTSARPSNLSYNPSWSWGSVIGEIDIQWRLDKRFYRVYNHTGEDVCFNLDTATLQNRDNQPELKADEKELEIRGVVTKALLTKTGSGTGDAEKWTVTVDTATLLSPGGSVQPTTHQAGLLEVFPDVEPLKDKEECCILVLAAGNSATSIGDVDSEDDEDATVSGVGVILQELAKDHHYMRCGAFSFHSLSPESYAELKSGEEKNLWLA